MEQMCSSMDEVDVNPVAKTRLLEDHHHLRGTCRRDSYCVNCLRAFCSHCCRSHHSNAAGHVVVPVGVDAAFPKHYPGSGRPLLDFVVARIAAADYATPHARDAYCLRCNAAFSTALCHHHFLDCGADSVLLVEERGGRHCVRFRGHVEWFDDLESVLRDPVGEDDDGGELMLVPLLTRKPRACVQCGGPVPRPLWVRCSPACAASHDRELARRRDARRAALQLANLHIGGSIEIELAAQSSHMDEDDVQVF